MLEYKLQDKKEEPNTFAFGLKPFRIVFMGTPEFAVASLDALRVAGFEIAGVVTAPDKPAGRGMKMNESAVKKYAVEHGLRILQPEKLKNPEFIEGLRALAADLQVVVAFRMLPEIVWSMPRLGSVNLHGSLLPQYRGAAPINWAVINGEKETGVTTFLLQHEIDTGEILMQESFPVGENDTAGEVHDRMKEIGARVLVETVRGLASGTLQSKPQTDDREGKNIVLRHAPKLFTENSRIDFNKPVKEVHDLVRGLSPFPGAYTIFGEKTLKIYRSIAEPGNIEVTPGAFVTDNKTYLRFACADGYLSVKELQLEGKKRMPVEDFVRGLRNQ